MKWFSSLAAAALLAGGMPLSQAGPDDDYISLYQLIEEADQLSANGQAALARDKYAAAQEALKAFQTAHPAWNPKTVQFRLRYLDGRLSGAPLPAARPAPVTPVPVAPAPAPIPVPAPIVQPAVPAAPAVNPADDLRRTIVQLQAEREVLNAKLQEALAAQPAAVDPRELAKAEARVAALQKEKELLKVAFEQEQAKAALAADKGGLAEANKQIEALKTQLAASAAPLTAMERELAAVRESAHTNALAVSALQSMLKTLNAEKSAAEKPVETAKASAPLIPTKPTGDLSDAAKQLEKERDELLKRLNAANKELYDTKARGQAAQLDQVNHQLTVLRTRLEVLEARKIPFTPDEMALFKQPALTGRAAETAAKENKEKKKTMRELPAGAGALIAEAQRAFNARRYDEAEKKYLEVLKLDDKNPMTLGNIAAVQMEMTHFADADASLKKALALDPEDSFNVSLMGILRFRQGNFDEALDLLSRAATADPKNPETQNYLGVTLSQKGHRAAAETALRKALMLAPGYAGAHHNLAVIYATQEPPSLEMAKYHYAKAIAAGHATNADLEKMISVAK